MAPRSLSRVNRRCWPFRFGVVVAFPSFSASTQGSPRERRSLALGGAQAGTPKPVDWAPLKYPVNCFGTPTGVATFVKQFDNVTPFCAFSGTDEPTSPSDRSQ